MRSLVARAMRLPAAAKAIPAIAAEAARPRRSGAGVMFASSLICFEHPLARRGAGLGLLGALEALDALAEAASLGLEAAGALARGLLRGPARLHVGERELEGLPLLVARVASGAPGDERAAEAVHHEAARQVLELPLLVREDAP